MKTKQSPSDSFSNDERRLIAFASLFQESFSIDWIMGLTGEKASQVLSALEHGVGEKCLIRKGTGLYSFSNSKEQKRWQNYFAPEEIEQLHKRIADLLIREFPANEQKARMVANHLFHTSNDLENCHWLVKAGDDALKLFQTEDALQCYTKALSDLSNLRGEEADSLFAKAAVSYSKISPARHDIKTILAVITEGLNRATQRNIKTYEALLNLHLAKIEWYCSQYKSAWRYFEKGWSIVKQLNDTKLLRSATTFSTFFLFWQGRFHEAVHSYEKSVADVDRFPQGRFPLLAGVTVGSCYGHIGQVSQGLGMLDAIYAYCNERGDKYMAAYAGCAIGDTMLSVRRMRDAIRYLEQSMNEAAQTHNEWVNVMSKVMLALAYHLLGEDNRSVIHLQEYIKQSGQVHMTVRAFPYLMDLCWAMEEGRLPHIEGFSLKDEVDRMIGGHNIFMKGVAFRYQGLLQRRENLPHERVIQCLNLSLKWLEESGDCVELTRSQFEVGREYFSRGEERKAREAIGKASHVLRSLGKFGETLMPDDLKALSDELPDGETVLKEILKLGPEVVTIRDNKELFQHILSAVNRITGAERGAIFLLERNLRPASLQLRASRNLTLEQIASPIFASSMKMIEDVASSGRGYVEGISLPMDGEINSRELIRSRICVPMILREKVIGVLYHDNRILSSAFQESDLELLAYFAALAAFALDNAKAYEEIQMLNQRLSEEKLYYEEQHLQSHFQEDIVGESEAIRRVLAQVDQVAKADANVLILGETGVGKELIARAIHQRSVRSEKSFIRVHCSALPESLISSELFGHEKGAFTGAIRRRIGRFELSDGGSLFLDEIGDLPQEVQIRLLRVLQSKEFERVGGSETIRSDFRLITATNHNLEEDVKTNRFRADLYYRLNVFPIHIPPLRDRKEDIPVLTRHFIKKYATKMGKVFERIPEAEMDKLIQYHWPGNVRELENIIERGIIISSGPHFFVPELAFSYPHTTSPEINTTLRGNETRHILWALKKTEWKVRGSGGAAEILNVHPSTLASRMRKLGITRPKGVPKARATLSSSPSDVWLIDNSLHPR